MSTDERAIIRNNARKERGNARVELEFREIERSASSQEAGGIWTIDLSSFLTLICC